MEILAERMRTLREGMKLSQAKMAKLVGTTQASINRYENHVGLPPHKTLLWYADYFDVSMDYIYGRTCFVWVMCKSNVRSRHSASDVAFFLPLNDFPVIIQCVNIYETVVL